MRNIKKKLKIIGILLAVIAVFVLLIYFGIFCWTMLGLLVLIVVLLHFSVSIHLKASRKEGIDIRAKYLFLTLYPRKKKASKKAESPPAEVQTFDDDLFDDADDIPDETLTSEDDPKVDIAAMLDEAEKIDKEEASRPEVKPEETKPEDEIPPGNKPSADKPESKPPKEKSKGKIAALKEKFEKIKPYIPIGWKAVKKFCKAIRFEGVVIQAEVGRFDAHEAAIYYGAVQKIVFDILAKIGLIFTLKLKCADVRCAFGENKIDGSAELTVRVRPSTIIAIAFCTAINFLRMWLKQRRQRKKAAKKAAAEAAQSNGSENAAQAAAS